MFLLYLEFLSNRNLRYISNPQNFIWSHIVILCEEGVCKSFDRSVDIDWHYVWIKIEKRKIWLFCIICSLSLAFRRYASTVTYPSVTVWGWKTSNLCGQQNSWDERGSIDIINAVDRKHMRIVRRLTYDTIKKHKRDITVTNHMSIEFLMKTWSLLA